MIAQKTVAINVNLNIWFEQTRISLYYWMLNAYAKSCWIKFTNNCALVHFVSILHKNKVKSEKCSFRMYKLIRLYKYSTQDYETKSIKQPISWILKFLYSFHVIYHYLIIGEFFSIYFRWKNHNIFNDIFKERWEAFLLKKKLT